jgi:hypothetical protein
VFKTLFIAAMIAAAPGLVSAKDFKIGEGAAMVSIPDGWEPERFEGGVEGTSPDKETYVAAEVIEASGIEDAFAEEQKFFTKNEIQIDSASKTEKEMKMAGLPAFDISWKATDKDGPTHVSLTLVKLSDSKILLLTYWGTEAGEKSNGKDLAGIADSIKAIK